VLLEKESGKVKARVRVMIVDDSAVYREFLSHVLSSDPGIEVAASVKDGAAAFDAVSAFRPDVITMDVNMPGMNGYDVTRRIMETSPTPIIVVSAADDAGQVGMSFKAMESGAVAVIPKVRGGSSPEAVAQAAELIQMVKLMAEVKVVKRWVKKAAVDSESKIPPTKPSDATGSEAIAAILIGASTGGPLPIRTILSALPTISTLPRGSEGDSPNGWRRLPACRFTWPKTGSSSLPDTSMSPPMRRTWASGKGSAFA
jgi:two-component system chemotaxis response regulator CheB